MALLTYIDESGTTNLVDEEQPVFRLVAVMVPDTQVRSLTTAHNLLLERLSDTYGKRFELHGCDIFQGTNEWRPVSVDDRVAALYESTRLLADHGASVAHVTIDKPKLLRKYVDPANPYLLALQFLCEKIDLVHRNEMKVLIADEAKEHETWAVSMVGELQRTGDGVVIGAELETIIDTLHFVDSRVSAGVQLADVVAWILQRRASVPTERDARTEAVLAEVHQQTTVLVRTFKMPWPR